MLKAILRSVMMGLAAVMIFTGGATAALIGPGTPIPDSRVLLNFNGTGLDWVYAGPVQPGEFGPGEIEPPSFRAAEGWRTATRAEWALRPDWDDFIVPGEVVPQVDGWTDFTKYRAAPEYWSTFTHVDLNDYAEGRVTDGVNNANFGNVYETIYVRGMPVTDVPAPGAIALFGVALLGLAAARRRT